MQPGFHLKLRDKIIWIIVGAALLPTLTLSLLVSFEEHKVSARVGERIERFTGELVSGSATNAYNSCVVANQFFADQIRHRFDLLHYFMGKRGITFGRPLVTWNAVNQYTKERQDLSLPRLLLGGVWIRPVSDFAVPVDPIDQVSTLLGGTYTFFQRIDAAGGMLRAATNVSDSAGRRAIGTFIPAVNPDGGPNPVVATVLRGETYRGRAYVVNAWYLTSYEPLRDAQGDVTGMLYVGIKQDTSDALREALATSKPGESGTVSVVLGTGETRGQSVIDADSNREGKSRWDERDADGNYYLRDIVRQAVGLKPGEIGRASCLLPGASGAREARIVRFAYFQPWDWVIVTTAAAADFQEIQDNVRDSLRRLLWESVAGGVVAMLLASLAGGWIAGRIAAPLGRLTQIAGQVARGRLEQARAAAEDTRLLRAAQGKGGPRMAPQDEMSQLQFAFQVMIADLISLVRQIKKSSIELISTATQISATSQEQSTSVLHFSASTNQIAAAATEISATSQELLKAMEGVKAFTEQTTRQVNASRAELGGMETSMRGIVQATSSISSKLSVISEKANNIGSVITTISKVADQTNLLSLNAAIEAEKAGEYGSGFAVVAREIRRLADQSAIAATDIEQMVKEMQSSVSSGVMEMDKFSEEVRRGVAETAAIGGRFGTIIEQVQALNPRLEQVHEGMQSQSLGALQISASMTHLRDAAALSEQSIKEFNRVAEQLRESVRQVKDEITRFQVS